MERKGAITFKGNEMILVGPEIHVADQAPDFTALNNDLQPVSLSDFKGEVVVISAVPSMDTPVCEMQTKRFNEEASKLDGKVIAISMDLPFAQKRFCDSFNTEKIICLSDYKDHSFANAYGLLIKELGLITRAVLVIDKEGKISYKEIVKEVTEHPNYEQVVLEAKKLGA